MWENLTSELEHFIGVRKTMPDRIIQNPERGDICDLKEAMKPSLLSLAAPRFESNANPSPRSSKASRAKTRRAYGQAKETWQFQHMRLFQGTVED